MRKYLKQLVFPGGTAELNEVLQNRTIVLGSTQYRMPEGACAENGFMFESERESMSMRNSFFPAVFLTSFETAEGTGVRMEFALQKGPQFVYVLILAAAIFFQVLALIMAVFSKGSFNALALLPLVYILALFGFKEISMRVEVRRFVLAF